MKAEYAIGMLWVQGPMSYVEHLCAKSFVDAGHHVKLYHYGDIPNAPDYVELVDGNEVLNADEFITHGKTGSFALFSDVFRYHMLRQNDRMIWADLDAYCVKRFESETGHFFAWESKWHINGGVLGLPPDSEALAGLLEMTEDQYGIPEWSSDEDRARMQRLKDAGHPEHVGDMPWGVWGPHAVTHYLKKTGEAKYAMKFRGLYPVNFKHRRKLMKASMLERVESMITDQTYSVHFYGRRVREYLHATGGLPQPGSYMDKILKKHEIDVEAAPVWSREEKAAAEAVA